MLALAAGPAILLHDCSPETTAEMSTDHIARESDGIFSAQTDDSGSATDRSVRQYLLAIQRSGVTHLPNLRFPEPKKAPSQVSRQVRSTRSVTPAASCGSLCFRGERGMDSKQKPAMTDEISQILARAEKTSAEKFQALCEIAELVSGCRRCTELAESRTQTVFGVGNPDARIMFIGEAPGADEDRAGEPFVGRAGQLLNRIIEACRLRREELYICNILRCRPPGNRNPTPQEAANCREFLDAQIEVVQPEYIVCWGTVAARNLLCEKRSIGQLRRQFFEYGRSRVLCTYHPSYLLRNPAARKDVWEDMKFLMNELGIEVA